MLILAFPNRRRPILRCRNTQKARYMPVSVLDTGTWVKVSFAKSRTAVVTAVTICPVR